MTAFPPLLIGTMRLGQWGAQMTSESLARFVDQCLELGLSHFDHADIYGNFTTEEEFGHMLSHRPRLRSALQLTSKCGIKLVSPNRPYRLKSYDASKEHIIASAEHSLKMLRTDYLDVFLIHRPDFLMDVHEIAEAFSRLQQQGKVKAFGVSNFSPRQFELLHQIFPLVTNQIEVSLLHLDAFQDGSLDTYARHHISPTAWSPLGGGKIFTSPSDPQSQRIRQAAQALQEKYDASLDQLLLAFLYKHPSGLIPVIGSSKIERIQSALKAHQIDLDREDWYALWQASTGETIA